MLLFITREVAPAPPEKREGVGAERQGGLGSILRLTMCNCFFLVLLQPPQAPFSCFPSTQCIIILFFFNPFSTLLASEELSPWHLFINHMLHVAAQAGRFKLFWKSKWSSALSDGFFLSTIHFSLYRPSTCIPCHRDTVAGREIPSRAWEWALA